MNLFFLAGETSGDRIGALLLKELKGEGEFWGVGGEKMRAQGLKPLLYTEEFALMGVTDTLLSLPKIFRQFYLIQDAILSKKPDGVILIDYPGFNLRLAKALRKKGYRGKIIQYVSPTIWAWGKERLKTMEKALDLVLLIFPFEEELFIQSQLSAVYVGNPIVESILSHTYEEEWHKGFGIRRPNELVALFPGSRKQEVEQNLPLQLEAAELFLERHEGVEFALSFAHEESLPEIKRMVRESRLKEDINLFLIPKHFSFELMRDARVALAKSGSVTLELALHQTPSVVTYKVSSINRFIAKNILKLSIKHFCIVNILKQREVFPERIAVEATAEELVLELEKLWNGPKREACIEDLSDLCHLLTTKRSSFEAAKKIRGEIGCLV